jgi:hypothetical protein
MRTDPRRQSQCSLAILAVATALCVVAAPLSVRADTTAPSPDPACAALGKSVDRVRDWFSDRDLPHRVSGSRLSRIDRAVEVALKPNDKHQFFLPPLHPLRAGLYAGSVTFYGVPHPGLYQVTLSEAADVDLFENGARIRAQSIAAAPNCPGVVASARFDLAPGDLVRVEIVNAPHSTIRAAFAEVPQ